MLPTIRRAQRGQQPRRLIVWKTAKSGDNRVKIRRPYAPQAVWLEMAANTERKARQVASEAENIFPIIR